MSILQSLTSMPHHILLIVAGLTGFGFLVGFHELGHFVFCKIFKVRTPSFSIGMGPRLITKKIGGTEFVLSAIPMGGYVEIAGLAEVGQGEQKHARRTDPYSFNQKPYYQKMLILAGGILFNLIFAYIALCFLYFTGIPKTLLHKHASTTLSTVIEHSPAWNAHLKAGDTIVAFENQAVTNAQELMNLYQNKPGTATTVTIQRDNQTQELPITIGTQQINKKEQGFLGIEFVTPAYPLAQSITYGIEATNHIIYKICIEFKNLFTQCRFDKIGGPLMVLSQTIKGAGQGFKVFLLLLAFISINLAIINIVPLPVFDGGQALTFTIEALIGKPLNEAIRNYIHYTTWILLLILIAYLSIKDILEIFCIKDIFHFFR